MEIVGPYPAVRDPDLLNALYTAVKWGPKSKSEWDRYFDWTIDFIYTALENNMPVGMGAGITNGSNESECYIISLCVHPEYQGRHIGQKIMKNIVNEARARGYERAKLSVPIEDPGKKGFYEKLGFQSLKGREMELVL